jgi:hypothetical protein
MFGAIGDIGRNDYPAFGADVNLGNIRDAGGRARILFGARAAQGRSMLRPYERVYRGSVGGA